MLILTMREHQFVGRLPPGEPGRWEKHSERTLAFATDLPLVAALSRVQQYQDAFRTKYGQGSVVEFHLLGAASVRGKAGAPKTKRALEEAGVRTVESLAQTEADF
jgi:hypothetical protein